MGEAGSAAATRDHCIARRPNTPERPPAALTGLVGDVAGEHAGGITVGGLRGLRGADGSGSGQQAQGGAAVDALQQWAPGGLQSLERDVQQHGEAARGAQSARKLGWRGSGLVRLGKVALGPPGRVPPPGDAPIATHLGRGANHDGSPSRALLLALGLHARGDELAAAECLHGYCCRDL